MDIALGAMGSLLPKLGELLKDEYKMQTGAKQDVKAFSAELASMRAALRRVSEVPRDQLDEEVKLWAGDVRELSYDMEDVVDSLLVRVKGSKHDADMDGFKELMSKMANLFKKGKARRQIATAVKDIKEQVQDVAARHERYKADGVFANLAAATRMTAVDPLLVALYEDKQRLVGIENARDELIEKLSLTADVSKQPKILSVVGFGGLESDVDTSTEEDRAMERSSMLSADAFPCVTRCLFENVLFAPYTFPRGAMPMVQHMSFGLIVSDILSGGDLFIRNLPSLQSVRIKLYGDEERGQRYSEAKAAVERAVADHPNRPNANILWRPTR